MSHAATAWAYRQTVDSAGRKFVLVALADFADEAWSCYPGQDRLATMTGQSVRSVRSHLARLEADGLIARQPRFLSNGQRSSDRYRLLAGVVESVQPPADIAGGKSRLRQSTSTPAATVAGYPLENRQETPQPPASGGRRAHCDQHSRYRRDCLACGRLERPTVTAVPDAGDVRCPEHPHEREQGCRACAADRKAGSA